MQSLNTLGWMAVIVLIGCLPARAEDTLGSLMQKQAQLLEVELDTQLSEKRAKLLGSTEKSAATTVGAGSPLALPELVAVYGMESHLTAEFRYKGNTVAVSIARPVIDRSDGWRVTRIQPGQAEVCRGGKKKAGCRVLALDWDAQAANSLAGRTFRVPLTPQMLNMAAKTQAGPVVPALDFPLAAK